MPQVCLWYVERLKKTKKRRLVFFFPFILFINLKKKVEADLHYWQIWKKIEKYASDDGGKKKLGSSLLNEPINFILIF